ncbi:hypothetical protein ACGFX4_09155 [Kitasatospora sp. NPDC048365]|uniref:hypothetical protein n=1 Tax=Kitasatospora sp. NPDC048365 TaxID=3364050 RepID=UPI00371DBF3B
MTTTPDQSDTFAAAVGEAVETSAVAVRLVLAIADAVCVAAEARTGRSVPEVPDGQALSEAAGDLRTALPSDVSTALIRSAAWPTVAKQLVALRRAGVDLEDFLPRVGRIAVGVRDTVLAGAARPAAAPLGYWGDLVERTLPSGPVREAVLASPRWPEIASAMQFLHRNGLDVPRLLRTAHASAAGVFETAGRTLTNSSRSGRAVSRDVLRCYGPLTVGLEVPPDLDLSLREPALARLGVSKAQNSRYVRWIREAIPDMEHATSVLVTMRQWPLLAARMAHLEEAGTDVSARLAHLGRDRSWAEGSPGKIGERLLRETIAALHRPAGDHPAPASVITSAARASSKSEHRAATGRASTAAPTTAPPRAQRPANKPSPRRG